MAEPTTQNIPTPSKTPSSGVKPPPEPRWLFYILSFVISLFGIIFGIIYMTKDDEENKKFGKICLILGIIPAALGCICWLLSMIFGFGGALLGGGDWEVNTYTY